MNINYFFLFLIVCLSMIFFLFEPRQQVQSSNVSIPSLELNNFTLSELSANGLVSTMHGEQGIKHSDRYEIKYLNYTDNSGDYISNIKAGNAFYKETSLELEDDIKYFREDGLSFTTQKANYNKKTNIITSTTRFISHLNKNTIQGSNLEYDITKTILKSKNVIVNYQLKERK